MKIFYYKFLMVFLALFMVIPPAWADETLIVCDGTAYNEYMPLASAYATSSATNVTQQIIYPKSYFADLAVGSKIKSIKFFDTSSYSNLTTPFGSRVIVVRIGEVPDGTVVTGTDKSTNGGNGTLYNRNLMTTYTEVYSGNPTINGQELSFTFTEDYTYNGGNLAIELYYPQGAGNGSTIYWYGVNGTTACSGHYRYVSSASGNNKYRVSLQAFLPKMSITYEGGSTTPTIEVSPESLTINDAAAGNFTVTGTNVDGNINASLGNNTDWYLNPTSFSNAGGETSVTYTGRALSASNTVTASAANDATVTASATVNYVADLYIVTDNGQTGNWDFSNGTHMTNNSGTYTATFTANADNTFILFARKLGDGVTWNTRYVFGPNSDGDWWLNGDSGNGILDLNDDDPIKIVNAGTYTITINSDGTFTITKVQPQVATPTFSPAEGTFTEAQTVTISCATDGATISYSTDGGSTWTQGNSLTVSETTTVMAKATKDGMTDSEVATATYTINTPSGPTGEVTVGDASTYTYQLPAYYPSYYAQTNQMIYPGSMLGEMVGNDITGIKFYTREGSTMNFSGTYSVALGMTSQESYSSATPITGLTAVVTEHVATIGVTEFEIEFDTPFTYDGSNLVVQFQVNTPSPNDFTNTYWAGTNMGYNVGYYSQYSGLVQVLPKATFTYASSIPTVATPTFTPDAGTYNSVQTVTISCATDRATISYSTDGGNTWTPYTGPITVSETTTIMAKAENAGMTTSEASAEYVIDIPQEYAVTVSPDGGTIDFGTVDNEAGATKSKTITITNTGLNPVTPTLSALSAPFSTDYTSTALQPGESMTITITFTPTAEGTFNGSATLSFGNGIADRNFTLTGKGGKYDVNDHSALYDYEYTWTDDDNVEHTSNLLETATDPNQIIAMLREVYTNKAIPGNKKRGYTSEGAVENWKVSYPAVGQLARNYVSGSGYSYSYTDAYGWNIPTEKPVLKTTLGSYDYYYLDPTEYEPVEEGVTLIMIELKDLTNFSGNSDYYSISDNTLTLKERVANAFKSARIIKDFKKSGTGEDAGTLFKIDADKLNRFFLIAKGQLRLIDHTFGSFNDGYTFSEPSYRIKTNATSGGSYTDSHTDFQGAVMYPFIHMFEQFSPNAASTGTTAQTDEYQKLINMESFYVIHDCPSAAFISGNHEFNMYGLDSESDDCQDVRDMMFFVPEYRMKDWGEQYSVSNGRDFSSEKFVNYYHEGNVDHRPKMGLYVIRQNEITGEQQANADVYDLNLSWESNLLEFLPGDEAEYNLYRVVIDQNTGEKTYEFVATIPSGQTTYVDHVDMEENGQVVTYVVQGQDTDHFLSLQLSNEESFIIPGTDKTSLMGLAPNGYHYSRFEPETETNYYANQLKFNRLATYVKGDYLGSGAKFTFKRSIDGGTTWTTVAEAVSNGLGTLTVTMQNQRVDGQYNHNNVDWIKMQNPSSVTYTVNANGYADLTNLSLFDNIAQSVIGNTHPARYTYQVELDASQNLDDTDTNVAHSNLIHYMIHKTEMDIEGYTLEEVNADTQHTLAADVNRTFDEQVKYSSKQEILRYDIYRWKDDAEKLILDFSESTFVPTWNNVTVDEMDIAPAGQAGNQGTEYTVKIDGVNKGSVAISSGETKYVTYADTVAVMNAGLYTYAPVVETFTLPREDYNTYGAPLQQTAVSKVGVEVGDYTINLLSAQDKEPAVWEEEDGNKYCHYTVKLNLTPINVPEGYDLYMVRAWRQVDRSLLNEQVWPKNPERNRDYRLTENGEYLMEQVDYTIFDKNTTPTDYKLGQSDIEQGTPSAEEVRATFGAQKLRTESDETGVIESLPMTFRVRAYYTRSANLNPSRNAAANAAADGKYYIAEATCDFTFYASDISEHTGMTSVTVDRVLTGVTYYNMMGQSSIKPFEGMNIVVKRYSDGTTSTAKVFK